MCAVRDPEDELKDACESIGNLENYISEVELQRDKAEAQLLIAKKALEFYANERTWRSSGILMCGHHTGARSDTDKGKTATKALKEMEK